MLRILICFMAPLIILFAGLSPAYMWAVPLLVGSIAITLVLMWGDFNERKILGTN